MNKLTLLQINIIGAVTGLILAIILFFAVIKPRQDEIATTQTTRAGVESSGGTQEAVAGKKRDLDNTIKAAKVTQAAWNVNSVKYMPRLPIDDKDVLKGYEFDPLPNSASKVGIKDLPTVIGTWVTSWFDVQKNQGITRLPGTEFPIDAIVVEPNDIAQLTSLRFPKSGSWPVQIEATSFNAAMAHLRRFNGMQRHGMPVINNVALSGQSPSLTVSYDLAMYVIPPAPPAAADPIISSTGASAAPGGAAGNPFGGGFPGGPGGYPGAGGRPGGALAGGGRGGRAGGKGGDGAD